MNHCTPIRSSVCVTLWTVPTFFYRGGRTNRRTTSVNNWDGSDRRMCHTFDLVAKATHYLFEASVLDVELLGVDKVKQLAVLLPEYKKGKTNPCGEAEKLSKSDCFPQRFSERLEIFISFSAFSG